MDETVFLKHILLAIEDIEKFVSNCSQEDFLRNDEKQAAVERRLEIIGEAVKNIPEEYKNKNSAIPWRIIASMRDNLIHEYFGIDAEIVWKTTQEDIPLLKNQIQKMLS